MSDQEVLFHKLPVAKILDIWGTSSLKAITVGGLGEPERMALLNKFIKEGGITFSDSLFLGKQDDFYVLWNDFEAIGILRVNTVTRLSKRERNIHIEPIAVFILKEYRGQGLGFDLCTTVARYISTILISTILIRKIAKSNIQKGDVVKLTLFADYESEQGETFCENFYAQLTQDGPLVGASLLMGVGIDSSLDAGY